MEEYRKSTLGNGLRLVTVGMPHLHSIEMACYIGVGGRHENPEVAGISHFLEHMVFRGTTDYPSSLSLEQAFETIGGTVNASTDAETTCFHSRLHPDRVPAGVALFASMLRRPLLTEIEVERRIILEEALEDLNEQGEDINPDNLTGRLLWPGNPLSVPTIGTRETIEEIDIGDLKDHHTRYYSPTNTVLVLTGRVRHEEALAAVEECFGDWQGPAAPSPLAWRPGDGMERPEVLWVRDSDSQVSLQLAFRTPGRENFQAVPLRVLRRVLSWGGTSRLMLQLRETLGLTYHVEANLALFQECGCFSIDLSVTPENLVMAAGELLKLLEELCRDPIGEDERTRVVRSYLYDLGFSRDHPDDMAVRYGWGELAGYLRTLEMDRRDIAAVTPGALLATAREIFVPGALKVAIVGPFRRKDRATVERLLGGYGREGEKP